MIHNAISAAGRVPLMALLMGLIAIEVIPSVMAQPGLVEPPPAQSAPAKDEVSPVAARVEVEPVARDDQIRDRLERILIATGWFSDPQIRVEEGVVFIRGLAESEELRVWAGNLARNTEGVAAVANQMTVRELSIWDFSTAQSGLSSLWRDIVLSLPLVMMGMMILAAFAAIAWLASRGLRLLLVRRVRSRLLRGLLASGAGVLVLVVGLYIVLRISGLTQLALTIVGGTGLIGLAVGIAFRDITENYLASIFLSIQRPFNTGDLVEIAGVTGYVRQLNVRTTILMTLDGTMSEVPNATVYKSIIRNFSNIPNRREDFVIGIGYEDRIDEAQEVARRVLAGHPAILDDPEPWVLAEELGKATVNLRVYYWLNGREHSWLKVRSSVIRLVKRAFQDHGISMPDEAREIIFPKGVPVTLISASPAAAPLEALGPAPAADAPPDRARAPEAIAAPSLTSAASIDRTPEALVTPAEGGLTSEAQALEEQVRQAHLPEDKENLLVRGSADMPAT